MAHSGYKHGKRFKLLTAIKDAEKYYGGPMTTNQLCAFLEEDRRGLDVYNLKTEFEPKSISQILKEMYHDGYLFRKRAKNKAIYEYWISHKTKNKYGWYE